MKKLKTDISVDKWFGSIYSHVKEAIQFRIGYCQNKTALMPFDAFFGKLVECIWYDRFIIEERQCTIPDFNLYIDNTDGGVDMIIANTINVSVKCRSLDHPKNAYLDESLSIYNKQLYQAKNKISKLINDNKKCNFIVGAIRYQTHLYNDWLVAWNNKDANKLKQITKDIINNDVLWFTTEYNKIIIEE